MSIITFFIKVKLLLLIAMKNDKIQRITSQIVEEFKKVRKGKSLSHEKLAKLSGLHRSTISLVESQKITPTIKTCLKIAKALDLSLGDLIKSFE